MSYNFITKRLKPLVCSIQHGLPPPHPPAHKSAMTQGCYLKSRHRNVSKKTRLSRSICAHYFFWDIFYHLSKWKLLLVTPVKRRFLPISCFYLCLRSVQPFCPYNTGTKEQDSELGETIRVSTEGGEGWGVGFSGQSLFQKILKFARLPDEGRNAYKTIIL